MSEELTLFSGLKITPGQMAATIRLVSVLAAQGLYDRAEKWLIRLAIIDPQNPYVFALLASVSQQQGKSEKAINLYSRAIEIFSQDVDSLTNRGELYLQSGKLKEAAADLSRAIQLDPQGNHPAAVRARLLVSMTAQALELVEKNGIQALDE